MSDGNVDVPKVGPLPKKVILPLAVGLAGFVAWRFYQNRQDAAADSTVTDGEFGAVDSSIPGVVGAVSPDNSYGSGDTGNAGDAGNDPTRFTNNAQWTDYVVGKLSSSDVWTYTDIVTALGLGLAGKPTTDTQQSILRAALAVAGQPPSGSILIVSGGNVAPMTAPITGRATATDKTFTMSWQAVAGADHYVITQSNGGTYQTSTLSYTVTGLNPSTSYAFKLAAANAAGLVGPSASVSGKTAAGAVAVPGTHPVGWGWVRVSAGASAPAIAKKEGISLASFYLWNGPGRLVPGEWVKVRGGSNPKSGYKG